MVRTRLYPIRTNRTAQSSWDIPLYRVHTCTSDCEHLIERIGIVTEESFRLRWVLNPTYINGRCDKYGTLEETSVRISSFDGVHAIPGQKLASPDMIVIRDSEFIITFDYPMRNPAVIVFTHDSNVGLTISEVIQIIRAIYTTIYEAERETASVRTYVIQKRCEECPDIDPSDVMEVVNPSSNDCSICLSPMDNPDLVYIRLKCNHNYHKKCIERWIATKNSNLKCPQCRQCIFECEHCDGSGIIEEEYTGAVIPPEHRGMLANRNSTDGVYGIYGHDLDDLFLEGLRYDRVNRELLIQIGS